MKLFHFNIFLSYSLNETLPDSALYSDKLNVEILNFEEINTFCATPTITSVCLSMQYRNVNFYYNETHQPNVK